MKHILYNLPQANRDTLVYLILHLQNVGSVPECKMTFENLAQIFGPIFLGHSGEQICQKEEEFQSYLTEFMLNISSDYWKSIQ